MPYKNVFVVTEKNAQWNYTDGYICNPLFDIKLGPKYLAKKKLKVTISLPIRTQSDYPCKYIKLSSPLY
jgi:hypothetical protein